MATSQRSSSGKPWEHAKRGKGSQSDPLAARFVESLSYDTRLYKHDIAGSIAHARMLRKVGLITPGDLRAITRGLKAIEKEIETEGDPWRGWRIDQEDVHMCIEAALIEKIGEPGRKLHTGRSRNDQVALDLKLWITDAVGHTIEKIENLHDAFMGLAGTFGRVVMPSYTHLQRAQPIVAGGELVAWAAALDRCAWRLAAVTTLNNENPLGSGAIAGSSLPLNRKLTEPLLPDGLASVSSIDATASRDAAADFLYALAMTAMTLSRWAEQWILYCSTEFGFITLDPRYTTGSSMMPQKRNPDMLELIRGRCGNVYGNLFALMTILKGLPIGYNRDLQEDKRHVFAAYDMVGDCLEMATRIVRTTKFNQERIAGGLERGFLDATSLAEYFVTRGIPFRTAHQIVGGLVATCEELGYEKLGDLAVDHFNEACKGEKCKPVAGQDVYQWLGAANVVKRYKTSGNAGISGFEEQLKRWKEKKRE